MNRSRTHQLLKIEKENENKDIKTKQKVMQPKGYAGSMTSNADKSGQLSGKHSSKYAGVKSKTFFSHDPPVSHQQLSKNRSMLQNEPYTASTDTYVKSIGMFPNHKPLGPYMAPTPGPKPRLGNKQIKRPTKDVTIPEFVGKKQQEADVSLVSTTSPEDPEACLLEIFATRNDLNLEDTTSETKNENDCRQNSAAASVSKILLSAREQSKSARLESNSAKSRKEQPSTCSDSSTYLNLDLDYCSLGSADFGQEVFHTAPLLPVPNAVSSSDSSATLERKLRNALNVTRNSMEDDDIKVVRKIVKTDERYSLLKTGEADPNLVKDILKTQLKEIVRNERVIKTAIKKLGSSPDRSFGISELANLLNNRNKRISERPSLGKSRKKKSSLRIESATDDSSPERKAPSNFEAENVVTLSDVMDNQSVKKAKSYYEKRYAYTQQDVDKAKHIKRATSAEAQKEYEEFLKSTLSFKQKVASKKPSNHHDVFDCPSQVDLQLNVVDMSEDDEANSKIARRPQVNVTFKNVRSLEKEIFILRALGDRLEASMKRTLSEPSLSDIEKKQELYSSTSMLSLTKEIQKIDPSIKVFPGRRVSARSFLLITLSSSIPWNQQRAGYFILAKGLRLQIGVVNEFVIVSKTIDELKCDASSSFYIPKRGQLERTSFEKLKAEPHFLLQNLKPKTAGVQFNLLDHDPIFFNSFLIPPIKSGASVSETFFQTESRSNAGSSMKNCEGGDSMLAASEGIRKTARDLDREKQTKRSRSAEKKSRDEAKIMLQQSLKAKEQPQKSTENEFSKTAPYLLGGDSTMPYLNTRHNRIRRVVTPMPFDAFDEPKNNLMKKILIGVIQVSIFMGLIMALTLPDIRC